MNKRLIYQINCLLFVAMVFGSCAVEKHLEERDIYLYDGATVQLADSSGFDKPKRIQSDLKRLTEPDRNTQVGLWYHFNFNKKNKTKGFSRWVQKNIGEVPSIFDTSDVSRSKLLMQDYLFDRGFFRSQIAADSSLNKNRRITVDYLVSAFGRYRFREIYWPDDTTGVAKLILNNRNKSRLISGRPYDVKDLIAERIRLENAAKNEGYYLFDADDLFYFVDSTASPKDRLCDLWLKIKPPEDPTKFRQFYIGETDVFPNYDLIQGANGNYGDTIGFDGINFYQNVVTTRPRVLSQYINQRRGDLYQDNLQRISLNHLLDLGIYKFVNQEFDRYQRNDTMFLKRNIFLTPDLLQDLSGEFEVSTRGSNFRLGAAANYSHKNIFNGAERLDLSLGTAVETGGRLVISDDTLGNNLFEVFASADLYIPRFILPFVDTRFNSSLFVPKTRIGLAASFQRRRGLYTLLNTRLSYGYDWRKVKQIRHELSPININLVNISNITPEFQDLLDSNERLANSFSNLFIFGPTYRYTYTNQDLKVRRNYAFAQIQLEAAGNLVNVISRLANGPQTDPYKIFGREYSQYGRIEVDYRYNWVGVEDQLVFRVSPGLTIPYGNSDVVPYTKQYFVGGPNSIRAFPNRGLLGSFIADPSNPVSVSNFDLTGEIKFESSLEYRYELIRALYLKGAFFMDVGNVWQINATGIDSDKKEFGFGKFFDELAVGVGTGVRLDIPFLVLRFDFSLPMRKPYLPSGQRWTWHEDGFFER